MDRATYVQRRKGKYMAQTLEAFEAEIEKLLPPEAAGAVQDFKGLVRARFNSLAKDATEIMSLTDTQINGAAVDLRDALSPAS